MATKHNDEMGKSQPQEGESDIIATPSGPDLVSLGNVDQALAAKMTLVNDVCYPTPIPCPMSFLTCLGH
jgi:hypothetical protein